MSTGKGVASVSLDVDNLWSYMKTHGDPGWERRPSYLPTFVPLVLDVLDDLGLRITFFVVGRDLERDENVEALAGIVRRGHEVGNHSFEHEPWLHRYTAAQLEHEIAAAEEAITRSLGARPVGFRGPGYSWSPELLELLARRGYEYDASTLPTYLGPLARAYYFATAKLEPSDRSERAALFGSVRDGMRPVGPYLWALDGGQQLLEIPVTTVPVLKVPFHLSYLVYVARYSERAALAYLRGALAACRLGGTEPSFLLHPLDLIGGDIAPQLRFFPGMNVPSERKIALFRRVLGLLRDQFRVVDMRTHARAISVRPRLRRRRPDRRVGGGG
jgi:hypothetical protein